MNYGTRRAHCSAPSSEASSLPLSGMMPRDWNPPACRRGTGRLPPLSVRGPPPKPGTRRFNGQMPGLAGSLRPRNFGRPRRMPRRRWRLGLMSAAPWPCASGTHCCPWPRRRAPGLKLGREARRRRVPDTGGRRATLSEASLGSSVFRGKSPLRLGDCGHRRVTIGPSTSCLVPGHRDGVTVAQTA